MRQGISQSSIIALFLLAGFVVFITIKGDLPAYLGAVGLGSQSSTAAPALPTVGEGLPDLGSATGVGIK